MTDIEIAQATPMSPIMEIAAKAGIDEKYIEQYGRYKAKVDYSFLTDNANKPDGKLILVTAITPTPAGEGKTTTSVGLTDGVRSRAWMLSARAPTSTRLMITITARPIPKMR